MMRSVERKRAFTRVLSYSALALASPQHSAPAPDLSTQQHTQSNFWLPRAWRSVPEKDEQGSPFAAFPQNAAAAAANPVAPLFSLYSSAPNAHTMSALDRPIFYAVTFINEVAAASSGTAAAAAAALKTGDWRILLDTRYGVYAASIAATVVWPFLRAAFTACVSDVSRG